MSISTHMTSGEQSPQEKNSSNKALRQRVHLSDSHKALHTHNEPK